MTTEDWKNIHNYFRQLPAAPFDQLFKDCKYPWEPLQKIESVFDNFFSDQISTIFAYLYCVEKQPEGGINVIKTKRLQTPLIDKDDKIYIGSGCLIEIGAMIKPNTVILDNCEIREGSYVRGNIFVDENCVLGHTTELKNTIFLKHVEAGHFVYAGDCIIGSNINIGAGTKLSNLRFRTSEEKQNGKFPLMDLDYFEPGIQHSLIKLGAVIGDNCELGCNSVTAPGVILSPGSWVSPLCFISKGFYPPKSFFSPPKTNVHPRK